MDLFDVPANFYPTPSALADKMLVGIDFDICTSFLEPEAGTGNLIKAISRRIHARSSREGSCYSVDCLEKDKYLRQILKYEFSEDHRRDLREKMSFYEGKTQFDSKLGRCGTLNEAERRERADLRGQAMDVEVDIHIVGDDFLHFQSHKRYDAVVMNPPFEDGELHLLRALEIQKHGGQVVCLLNAETLKKPYTNSRKLLAAKLEAVGATVEYLQGEFDTSETERRTVVEVALIRVSIPRDERKSFIFEELERAKEQEQPDYEPTDLLRPGDNIHQMVEQFNFEVEATTRLIDEYYSIRPYIMNDFSQVSKYAHPILELTLHGQSRVYDSVYLNKYIRLVRLKYWRALFHNPEFTGMLTSNLQNQFQSTVEQMADYDFSEFNIQQVVEEMNRSLVGGVESTIVGVFDEMSAEHSYHPECKKNIHYYNGWKTNKAHKINKRVILPMNGAFAYNYYSKKYDDRFDKCAVFGTLSDIEKALNYLDMGETGEVDLESELNIAADNGITRNIPCKYFTITLYKKGTCHITFRNQDIVDKLNIYGCRHKGWLPPSYGKSQYTKMNAEEKAVIDEFQGKEAYQRVMAEPDRWIVDTSQALLTAGA